jgi:hypothetical protein
MTTLLVKFRGGYYKVKVNPSPAWTERDDENYSRLCRAYQRQSKRGRLASMIYLHRQILKMEAKMKKRA